MPRQPKPYLRKQTGSWYCSIGGRQISLGKDREFAFDRFYELMGDRDQVKSEATTLYELSQVYLEWCEGNRSPATYKLHRHYLCSFIGTTGRRMRPAQLRVHHVVKWYECLGAGTTTQGNAVSIVQRMQNWSVEQQHIHRNPIKGMKKPKQRRRDVFYTSEQWKQIREHATGPLLDLLDFLYGEGLYMCYHSYR